MLLPVALLLLAVATPAPAAAPEPAFVAVVDPGHGGDKDGAIGPDGVKEKDLALAIARRVADRLRAQGGLVLLTREGDEGVDLARRSELANAAGADFFLSIHLNSMASAAARARTRGVETYFMSPDATDAAATAVAARENADHVREAVVADTAVAGILDDLVSVESLAESSRLAHAVHERLVAGAGGENLGVKQAPFHVLAGARMPAVLVEVGFVSHRAEAKLLATAAHQDRIAEAIAEGVAAFRAGAARAAR